MRHMTQQVFAWRLAESDASKYLFMLERTWHCISSTCNFVVNQSCINIKMMWSPCWIRCYISDWVAWVSTELAMMDEYVLNLQQLSSELILCTTQINICGSCLVLHTCRSQCQSPCCPQWEMKVLCLFSRSEDSLCLESRQYQKSSSGSTDNTWTVHWAIF